MTSSEEDDQTLGIVIKEENLDPEEYSWKPPRRGSASAFSPYKPVTVLTNLQRGNIETQSVQVLPEEFTFHSKGAMGELVAEDFTGDINVNEQDCNGLTSLMWAASYGQLPTVRLLLQNKAKVDIEGEDGETALLLAASGGHHEVVRLLLNFGADPDHIDHLGNSALMYAAHGDHAHCIQELLDSQADLTVVNSHDMSAFKLAVTRGNKRAQVVMERHMLRMFEPS